jgi:hypothetical protein
MAKSAKRDAEKKRMAGLAAEQIMGWPETRLDGEDARDQVAASFGLEMQDAAAIVKAERDRRARSR